MYAFSNKYTLPLSSWFSWFTSPWKTNSLFNSQYHVLLGCSKISPIYIISEYLFIYSQTYSSLKYEFCKGKCLILIFNVHHLKVKIGLADNSERDVRGGLWYWLSVWVMMEVGRVSRLDDGCDEKKGDRLFLKFYLF